MRFRGPAFRDMLGQPKTRGFLWGAGAVMTAYFLWPAVKEAVRPASKGVIRGAMAAGDRFRYAMSSAREGIEDVVAEAHFDRVRENVADNVEAAGDSIANVIRPGAAKPPQDNG